MTDHASECDLCGKAACPDADLPEFSEPVACEYLPIYNSLRYDRCEYGCARDITKATIRRDIVPEVERTPTPAMTDDELATSLRRLADDHQMLWEVARRAIEDALVEFRDGRTSELGRNNGFVIKERDGSSSSIIRFGPETGVRIALLALADHLSAPLRRETPQ